MSNGNWVDRDTGVDYTEVVSHVGYLDSGVYYELFECGIDVIPNHPNNRGDKVWLTAYALKTLVQVAKEANLL